MKTPDRIMQIFGLLLLGVSLVLSMPPDRIRGNAGVGLYNESSKILELHEYDFKCQVFGSPKMWVVEFYYNWCGHCQRFAPYYQSMAQNLSAWNNVVSFAAFDCAIDVNSPICMEFEGPPVPNVKLFSVNSESENNYGVKLPHKNEDDFMKNLIEDELVKEYKEGRGNHWPNLTIYESPDSKELWNRAPAGTDLQFLILEEPSSRLGLEVILDLHRIKGVAIRRSQSSNQDLLDSHKISSLPAVIVLSQDGPSDLVKLPQPTRESVKEAILNYLSAIGRDNAVIKDTHEVGAENRLPCLKPTSDEIDPNDPNVQIRENFLGDLENALIQSLKREVAFYRIINTEKFQALMNYIEVLLAYVPRELQKSLQFVSSLKSKLQDRTNITGKEYWTIVEEAISELPGKKLLRQPYVVCKGSQPRFSGYPCGLWTLFHTLTVVSAQEGNKLPGDLTVLKAMHGYIKNFFGCQECAKHFVEMSERRKLMDISEPEDGILWLWAAHNEVDERLAGDITEDPTRKKIQYPGVEDCPECRDENNNWMKEKVLNFLKKHYDPRRVL